MSKNQFQNFNFKVKELVKPAVLDDLTNLLALVSQLTQKKEIIANLSSQLDSMKVQLKKLDDVSTFNVQLNKTIHEFTLNEINTIMLLRTKSVFAITATFSISILF